MSLGLAYGLLAVAIVFEAIGTLSLKASEGMSKPLPTLLIFLSYGVAFTALAQVVKVVPLGVVYAIWAGAGVALIVVLSAVIYREIPDAAAVIGMVMIFGGVVVIHGFSKMTAP